MTEIVSKSRTNEWLTLLSQLVEINTETHNVKGSMQALQLLAPHFERLGFTSDIVPLENNHHVGWWTFPNEKPQIVLVGHIDTVFQRTSDFSNLQVIDDIVRGPGVIDMKGGLVLIIKILENFSNIMDIRKIAVLINDDEEIGSSFSKKLIKELVGNCRYGLVFEPGFPDGSVVTSHSGVAILRQSVLGKTAHAGLDHSSGINAALELAHKAIAISSITDYKKNITVNIGVINGGTKSNVVCEHATADIDLRFDSEDAFQKAVTVLQVISKTNYSKQQDPCESQLEVLNSMPCMPSFVSDKLFEILHMSAKNLGLNILGRHASFGSDGNYLAAYGLEVISGLGPFGGGMHTTDEFMTIESFEERLSLCTKFIKNIFIKN
jgi:glutamate carboxypeptidase